MSSQINTELKVPDLWLDFYARFLPGSLFVGMLYILWPGDASVPSGWSAAVLALAGYMVGLLVQPLSSEVTGLLHRFMDLAVTGDAYFVHRQKRLDPLRILSKMHGETTFFVQCFFLSIILLVLKIIPSLELEGGCGIITGNIIFALFVLLMAIDTAWRRVRRAQRLKNEEG